MADSAGARAIMVDSQLRTNDVTDRAVLAAMATTPREAFVPAAKRALAYLDKDIELNAAEAGGRVLMKPMVAGKLIQLAAIGPQDVVLDIGCGTGYSAAILSRIAGSVVALEADADLAAEASERLVAIEASNAAVVNGPHEAGLAKEGPYDAIVIEGAVDEVPEAILAQLKDGGRLVAIVGRGNSAKALCYTRSGDNFGVRMGFNASAPILPGFARAPGFVF